MAASTPHWFHQDGELEATVSLADLNYGEFHIVDACWAHVMEASNGKGTTGTAMTFRAYIGPNCDSGDDRPDWPSKDAAKKDWVQFVNELPTKVVARLGDAINRFAGVGADEDDTAGN